MSGSRIVYDGGDYTPLVSYSIQISNNDEYHSTGHETIFNPYVTDDLSDIDSKLEAFCGVTDGMDRVSNISHNGQLSGTTITWDGSEFSDIAPGG